MADKLIPTPTFLVNSEQLRKALLRVDARKPVRFESREGLDLNAIAVPGLAAYSNVRFEPFSIEPKQMRTLYDILDTIDEQPITLEWRAEGLVVKEVLIAPTVVPHSPGEGTHGAGSDNTN